ncbi:MAG: helix-turn-helix transcriptional regulator [Salibacteraceae bacterium]
MRVKLHDPNSTDFAIENHYPEGFSDAVLPLRERSFEGNFFFGRGRYREIYFEGIHIGFGCMELSQHTQLAFESDFESVELHFTFRGSSKAHLQDRSFMEFGTNQHNIVYADQATGISEMNATNFEVFEVNLSPHFFQKYLPEDVHIFERFRDAITRKKSGALAKDNLPITPAMTLIIQQIMNCERTGMYKKIFLEAKVVELLLLQLEHLETGQSNPAPVDLKRSDIEKLYAVKELLESETEQSYTLLGLARKVGTNEFTLKKGFKSLFGTTVFNFWHDIKMDKARQLLLDHGWTIAEVSDAVGYKHAHHFSNAFKKKYGVAPSQLKQGRLSA